MFAFFSQLCFSSSLSLVAFCNRHNSFSRQQLHPKLKEGKKKINQFCSLRRTFLWLRKAKRRRAEEQKTNSGMWSLATPHSTGGELYHIPPLQTKHTAPNKDGTVRRSVEERCHRQQLWSTLLCALCYIRKKKKKRQESSRKAQERYIFTHHIICLWTLESTGLDTGGPHQCGR